MEFLWSTVQCLHLDNRLGVFSDAVKQQTAGAWVTYKQNKQIWLTALETGSGDVPWKHGKRDLLPY